MEDVLTIVRTLISDALVKSRHSGENRSPDNSYRFEKTIGVGAVHCVASPLPPNRTGGSPASGSPVSGFTSARTGVKLHGHLQG